MQAISDDFSSHLLHNDIDCIDEGDEDDNIDITAPAPPPYHLRGNSNETCFSPEIVYGSTPC